MFDQTISQLERALELNPNTFDGMGAETRTWIGTRVPGGEYLVDGGKAGATEEWVRLMQPEALRAMGAALKGATTDFELNKFIELLADPSTSREVRAGVIQNMLTLAKRQRAIAETRIRDLGGAVPSAPGMPAAPSAPNRSAAPDMPSPGDIVDGYRFRGGDPANPASWEPAR